MRIVNISEFGDTIVLHFQGEGKQINAYTLASALVSIADAAKAANSQTNHGHDVEIVVEAFGQGSFRAKLRAVYKTAANLFSSQTVQALVWGIVANFIYERTLSRDNSVSVTIQTSEVIIQHGDERIVVPRTVYDATRKAERSPQFVAAVSRTFSTVGNNPAVTSFALVPKMDSPPPEIAVPKAVLQQAILEVPDEGEKRVITERCELQIVKAILQRSQRKWEFSWRGVKISAPVLDDGFYQQFFAHSITIAPGDSLDVELTIQQSRDRDTGVYTNEAYEVTRVLDHRPSIRQMPLTMEPTATQHPQARARQVPRL